MDIASARPAEAIKGLRPLLFLRGNQRIASPFISPEHLLTVLRYVERNPLRAKMVERAQDWRWSSLGLRRLVDVPQWLMPGDRWPVRRRDDWLAWVNRPQTMKEVDAIRLCVKRGRPYGSDRWVARTAK